MQHIHKVQYSSVDWTVVPDRSNFQSVVCIRYCDGKQLVTLATKVSAIKQIDYW